jgi:Tfp pilus assembly protein PilF
MQYKNTKNKRIIDIGRELGAGTLLEGSVRKAGNRVRIAVQLIDVARDEHLWGEKYDRELEDVFSIQSEIAENVAASLKIRLLSSEKNRIGKAATLNTEAHTLYLKGCYQLNRNSKESYMKAIQFLEEATAKDPGYALAYARLASTYAFLGLQALSAEEYAFSKSEVSARKALELDESLPDAHMSLGFVLLYKWNLSGADVEFRRAIEMNPNFASAHVYYANLLYFTRRFDESVTEIKKALELDPFSAETSNWAGTAYLYAGYYDESIEQFRNALEIDPNIMMAQNNLGIAYVQKGMPETGIAEILKAVEQAGESGFPQVASDLGYAYSKMGKLEETRKVLQKLLDLRNKNSESTQFAIPIAGLFVSLGEKEKAMDWLEEAYNQRSAYLISINPDLVFDGLRNEPRFLSLLKKIGLRA